MHCVGVVATYNLDRMERLFRSHMDTEVVSKHISSVVYEFLDPKTLLLSKNDPF